MQTKKRIILGSASPRRRELLEQIGISFEVRVSDKEEVYHSLIPEEIVKELALSKAENVADDLREKQEQVKQISFDKKNNVLLDTIVIGADTIVVSDGSILGKPKDEADAVRMIRSLQGRSHKVYTGVAILDYDDEGKRKSVVHAVETEVFVNPMSDEEIREYAAKVFKAVDGHGLSRVDFFLDKDTNQIYFNEINTIPGFTKISMYPQLMNDLGIGYSELLDRLIALAFER